MKEPKATAAEGRLEAPAFRPGRHHGDGQPWCGPSTVPQRRA